jgi:protein tyrosine/serine phosphatase
MNFDNRDLPPMIIGPGSKEPKEALIKISALLNASIWHFINLMEPTKLDQAEQSFFSYTDLLESIAAIMIVPMTFDHLPIKDTPMPTERFMAIILNQIDQSIRKERPNYVHCLGGKVRTGTVVGWYLMRH